MMQEKMTSNEDPFSFHLWTLAVANWCTLATVQQLRSSQMQSQLEDLSYSVQLFQA